MFFLNTVSHTELRGNIIRMVHLIKGTGIYMDLGEQITALENSLHDLKKRWPAHSVKPSMIEEMEELESEIERLRMINRTVVETRRLMDMKSKVEIQVFGSRFFDSCTSGG